MKKTSFRFQIIVNNLPVLLEELKLVSMEKPYFGEHDEFCEVCAITKATHGGGKHDFKHWKDGEPGIRWALDIKVFKTPSIQGNRYVLRFVDPSTSYVINRYLNSVEGDVLAQAVQSVCNDIKRIGINVRFLHGDQQFDIASVKKDSTGICKCSRRLCAKR